MANLVEIEVYMGLTSEQRSKIRQLRKLQKEGHIERFEVRRFIALCLGMTLFSTRL